MDKVEAAAILKSELTKYRERSYHSLQDLLTDLDAYEVRGPSGKFYQLEVQAFWDGEPNGNMRVSAGIDDGGLISSFSPLTDDFILSPSGEFIDEKKTS